MYVFMLVRLTGLILVEISCWTLQMEVRWEKLISIKTKTRCNLIAIMKEVYMHRNRTLNWSGFLFADFMCHRFAVKPLQLSASYRRLSHFWFLPVPWKGVCWSYAYRVPWKMLQCPDKQERRRHKMPWWSCALWRTLFLLQVGRFTSENVRAICRVPQLPT